MSISVPHRVLNRGFEISGDIRSGYHATVPYLVRWADALRLTDDAVANPKKIVDGNITWRLPMQFPGLIAACRCTSFRITPCGADGRTPRPNRGLKPGEFFTHAIVVLQFDTPALGQGKEDDPTGQQQLDPANPLTMCEQSTKTTAKMVTQKGSRYRYISDQLPIAGDFSRPKMETKLVLKFPQIPWIPWQIVQPYINKLNKNTIFLCDPETLLFEGMSTEVKFALNSLEGGMQQSVVFEFAYDVDNWNKVPRPDGTLEYVYWGGDDTKRIYETADFMMIFDDLEYEEEEAIPENPDEELLEAVV